jgi:hypothetical protein
MLVSHTTMCVNPSKLDEMTAAMPGVSAQLKEVNGVLECKACWDANGNGYVFALYETQAHAEAAMGTVRGIWGGLASMLTAPPQTSLCPEVIDLLH